MAIEFKLPELGENIETIQVIKVLVAPGDTISEEQPLFELETDKATLEVPSSVGGIVQEVLATEGSEVTVGQVMLTVAGEGEAAPPEKAPEAPKEPESATEPTAPTPVAEVVPPQESEPASAPPPATEPQPAPPRTASAGGATPYSAPAAPSVRRFAREIGIDVNQVKGSGPHGRVSIEDVKLHATAAQPPVGASASPPLHDFEKFGPVTREKMSVIRRKTAEHMGLSWGQIPHVTVFDQADITDLDRLRKQYADRAVQQGGKLTMAVMVCKVAAAALRMFPRFNSSIDMTAREIILKSYVNLGVAVSTDRGLVVPVIKDADRKNMVQIAVEIGQIAAKAREGRIELSDLEGGTFTVTNLGRICGTFFTPIINYPEVAILGIGRAQPQPVIREGAVETRTMLPLSLSFDHRIIDGSDGAQFLRWVIDAVEQPLLLSLEG